MDKKAGQTFGGNGYVYGIDCGHGFMGLSPHSLRTIHGFKKTRGGPAPLPAWAAGS